MTNSTPAQESFQGPYPALEPSRGLMGFINAVGEFIIDAEYRQVTEFFEGRSLVCDTSDRCSFIDTSGVSVFSVESSFQPDVRFSEGLVTISAHDTTLTNIFDRDGNRLAQVQSGYTLKPFSELLTPLYLKLGDDWRYVYINPQGTRAMTSEFRGADSFHDGRARIEVDLGEYAFIDNRGELNPNRTFRAAQRFSEGLAWVEEIESDWRGYIDIDGERVVDTPLKGRYGEYNNGLSCASMSYSRRRGASMVNEGERYGFMDREGRWLVQPNKLLDASNFSSALAFAKEDSKYGYLNMQGQWAIEPRFDRCSDFRGALAEAMIYLGAPATGLAKRGYINRSGEWVYTWKSNERRGLQ